MTHQPTPFVKALRYHRAHLSLIFCLRWSLVFAMISRLLENDTLLRREEVYHRLRRDILDCALPPGTELHEPELAERFSISKSPIRDALLRLEAERLVVVWPRKGYQVAPVSQSDARDLFEFRALIERVCVMNAAEGASNSALAALDTFRSLDEPARFIDYNRTFHLALAKLCDNRRIAQTGVELIEQFDRLVIASVRKLPEEEVQVLIAEHGQIIDALQARAGKQAGRLLSTHIGRARRRVLSALSQAAIVS
jgi:GntR family transcriptional regulator, rspAB operon transcriptional repressor